jgi:hypothetical protein
MSTLSTIHRSRAVRPARLGVPWATVLTLAAAMSCACGFWLVSLQGAIGATQRAGTPFATWLMLSAVLLPVLALGVLGVLTLAKRWSGPALRGPRSVILTGLLVVAVGTLVGVAAIGASSLYDYRLQLPHIQGGMHAMAPCAGACIPREQHDILVLHLRGVLLVGRWLLLTNAVLVAWLVALWGGRIRLATGSTDDDVSVDHRIPTGSSLRNDVRLLLAGALAGAAVIHAAVVPEHLHEWKVAGLFFIALTAAEIAVACLCLGRRPGRGLLLAAAAVSVVPLMAWLWSRTLGLPFGPEPGVAEAVGVPDVLACVLEVIALLAVLGLLKPGRLVRPPLSAHTKALAVLALIAVTAIGFAATGPSWFDAFGVSASDSSMEMSG